MIAALPLGSPPESPVPSGAAVFWVSGRSQHAGIAAETGTIGGPIEVYAVMAPNRLRERWASDEHFTVVAVGWLGGGAGPEVRGRVLWECDRIEALVRDRAGWGRTNADEHGPSCCRWQIRRPYRLLTDVETGAIVFTGSCAGFVEHCYEVAGVDLVAEGEGPGDSLPMTVYTEGEAEYIRAQYRVAEGAIRRLYPSYQIRAFQLDEYPWTPDLRYRWFPDGF